MAKLDNLPTYFVVKCAGDNTGPGNLPDINGFYTLGPKVSAFVYMNGFYSSEYTARYAAMKAAEKMPGNRYYVVKQVGGYMAHEPKMDSF